MLKYFGTKFRLFHKSMLLTLIYWSVSCTQPKESTKGNTVESITKHIIAKEPIKTIYLDSLSSSSNSSYQYLRIRSQEFLYVLNQLNNYIEKYDYLSGKLIDKQKLHKEGPNGVGEATNFYVHSPDSIFVMATYQFQVTLIDGKANVKKRYSLLGNKTSKKEVLGESVISYGDEAGKMTLLGKNLIISASPFNDPNLLSYYTKGYYGLTIDLETGAIKSIMKLPQHWKENFEDGYRLTSQENMYGQEHNTKKNLCIMSLLTESELYVTDLKTNQVKQYFAGSSKLGKIPWMSRKVTDFRKEFSFFIAGGFYPAIHYDKYRDIYLRFVAIENTHKKGDDGKPWVIFNIILLDSKFKILKEIELSQEYMSSNVVITPKMTYLKLESHKENTMKFIPIVY